MTDELFYCSELSRRSAESTFGTASMGSVWLLLEYPHPWGSKVLEESNLPSRIQTYLCGLIKQIPHSRLLFIKKGRKARQEFKLFAVYCREKNPFIATLEFENYEQLMTLDANDLATGSFPGAAVTGGPLFLVCTHGRRDKCCAKFGYNLYKTLKPFAGGSLWQSSHVGGDRFAANMVCFPHALFYAHVDETGGNFIVDEYQSGRMVLNGYRGRACYGRPGQSADFFIRSETGLRGLDDLRYLRQERVSHDSWRVQFGETGTGIIHEATISTRPSEFQNFVTCHSTEEQKVAQFVLNEYRRLGTPSSNLDL